MPTPRRKTVFQQKYSSYAAAAFAIHDYLKGTNHYASKIVIYVDDINDIVVQILAIEEAPHETS